MTYMITDKLLQANLTHEAGAFDTDLATRLEADCEALFDISRDDLYFTSEWQPMDEESPAVIDTRNYPLERLTGAGYSALSRVLELHHPYADEPNANVLINRQRPGAVQRFHGDVIVGIQVIVYASNEGAFDFKLDPEVDDYETVLVNAGDLLRLNRPLITHRGRNPSEHVRFNLVLSSGAELY